MSAEPASSKPSLLESDEQLAAECGRLMGAQERQQFLALRPELMVPQTVLRLKEAVLRQVRSDPGQAMAIAEVCLAVAERIEHPESLAHALRAKANGLYGIGDYASAVEYHRRAAAVYTSLGDHDELARTLSASIQPHLLLGQYDEAFAAAAEARKIFEATGNRWRIARLDINLGNIYHRQDRFEEALECYQRAHKEFLQHSDVEATAAVLSNIATCQITLNQFASALATYQQAREFCLQNRMPVLVALADYNIAWLYYLRGDYGRAIQMLRNARESSRNSQNKYVFALCHMDLSEIYLDLNLSEEASDAAREGIGLFESLGMGYENAKCVANLATALGQQGQAFRALELFAKAREMFVREQNSVWPSLIDLYQALLLCNEGRLFEARRLCAAALEFFEGSTLKGKAVLCHLLMARLHAQNREHAEAIESCAQALETLKSFDAPILSFQANLQLGELLSTTDPKRAFALFQVARQHLETLRGSMQAQELKIAFMKNRLAVYERLIELCLAGEASSEQAFEYIEQSKSRALTDLLFQAAPVLQTPPSGQSSLAQNIRERREELNWYYHRIEQEQLREKDLSPARLQQLQHAVREREEAFIRVLRELPGEEAEAAGLRPVRSLAIEEIRGALPEGAAILEYFQLGDKIMAAVLDRTGLAITPVTLTSRVSSVLRLLQFQMSKFQLGADYASRFAEQLLRTTQAHLNELHKELIAPIRSVLDVRHVIVVPHGILHYLPFHAFYDGEKYLDEQLTISYAPSSSIFALCEHRARRVTAGEALVFGIGDERAPQIIEEARIVASALAHSRLFLGSEATAETLQQAGAGAQVIHIASHGFFRQDNPMFSGIRMGDSYLSLYDLYQFKLPADLITLSGCATGLTTVSAGDELMGLVRGLLHAGARSLVLSLWNVHDRSTTELMQSFYNHLRAGVPKVEALQKASSELRKAYPHPYYWACFKLTGSIS